MRRQLLLLSLSAIALFLVSCQSDPVEVGDDPIHPSLSEVTISPNAHNVVSAIVTLRVEDAVDVGIEYGVDELLGEATPLGSVDEAEVTIPMLGLRDETTYMWRVVAVSSTGHETRSDVGNFTTGSLPADIPDLSLLANTSPQDGFVMFSFPNAGDSLTRYAMIVNNEAEIVWYRAFSDRVVDFEKQAGGGYTLYSSIDEMDPRFYELDNLGNIVGEFSASDDYSTGPHEYIRSNNGYCLFAVEQREMDLSAVGGLTDAQVRGTSVEYHRFGGEILRWNIYDHMLVTDAADDIPLTSSRVNPWHGNAIEIDADDNILVSFRNSDGIVKIDSQSGEVLWRLGGRRGEFTFVDDPLNGFSHQHSVRSLPNGNVMLFDNGNFHDPQASRAVEYEIDEEAGTARLVWAFNHDPALYGFAMGSVQRLENGSTLINYGTAQRIVEVDASGAVSWELAIDNPSHFVYRALRINSLY